MESDKLFFKHNEGNLFVKMLTISDVSEINRVLGILEGLSYGIQDPGTADGLLNAIERIEAVVNKECGKWQVEN